MGTTGDVTRLLDDLNAGVNGPADKRGPTVSVALRSLADHYPRPGPAGPALQPTARGAGLRGAAEAGGCVAGAGVGRPHAAAYRLGA